MTVEGHSSEYTTLAAPAEASFREKMSKFIAFAVPIDSVDDAKKAIASITRDYHDARHICWAYMLGADGSVYQSTDNGEPSGTAGRPILGQIRSAGMTNLLVAVVRYFGGIKLGTSGLIVAYREAARLAIAEGEAVVKHEMGEVKFTFPYISMNSVMREVKESGAGIAGQEFDNTCRMTLSIRADRVKQLSERLADIDGVSIVE